MRVLILEPQQPVALRGRGKAFDVGCETRVQKRLRLPFPGGSGTMGCSAEWSSMKTFAVPLTVPVGPDLLPNAGRRIRGETRSYLSVTG